MRATSPRIRRTSTAATATTSAPPASIPRASGAASPHTPSASGSGRGDLAPDAHASPGAISQVTGPAFAVVDAPAASSRAELDCFAGSSPPVPSWCSRLRCARSPAAATARSGRECDDGNTVGGDGCSASCLLPWAVVVAGQSNAEGRSTIYQDLPTGRVTSPDPGTGLVSRMFRARYTFDTGVGFPVWTRANSWPCSDLDCTPKPGGTCEGRTAATHVALDPLCTCHCGTTDTDANESARRGRPSRSASRDVGRGTELVQRAAAHVSSCRRTATRRPSRCGTRT